MSVTIYNQFDRELNLSIPRPNKKYIVAITPDGQNIYDKNITLLMKCILVCKNHPELFYSYIAMRRGEMHEEINSETFRHKYTPFMLLCINDGIVSEYDIGIDSFTDYPEDFVDTLNARDYDGNTIFMLCVLLFRPPLFIVMKKLIDIYDDYGKWNNLLMTNHEGQSLIDLSLELGNVDIITLLHEQTVIFEGDNYARLDTWIDENPRGYTNQISQPVEYVEEVNEEEENNQLNLPTPSFISKCQQQENLLGEPLSEKTSIFQIEGQRLAECISYDDLKGTLDAITTNDTLYLWEEGPIRSNPVYKLIFSNIPIQTSKSLLLRYNTFKIVKIGIFQLGSEPGGNIGSWHGEEREVYRAIPINRKNYNDSNLSIKSSDTVFKPDKEDYINENNYKEDTVTFISENGSFSDINRITGDVYKNFKA